MHTAPSYAARTRIKGLKRLSARCALAIGLIAALVLFGWARDIDALKRIAPGMTAMNPVSAVTFIVAAAALWLRGASTRRPGMRNAARVAGALVLVTGSARILGYMGILPFPVDQWLFSAKLPAEPVPSRMAPNTALNFLMIGASLLLSFSRKPASLGLGQILALIAGFFALLAIVGYGLGVKTLYGITSFIPMALHTAASFMLLSIGIILVNPGRGVAAIRSRFLLELYAGYVGLIVLTALIVGVLVDYRLTHYPVEYTQIRGIVLFGGGVAAAVALVAGFFFAQHVTAPLRAMTQWADAVAAGRLAAPPALRVRGEVGELIAATRRMNAGRELAESELRQHTRILKSILDSMGDGVVVADPAGRFRVFNPAAERILGAGAMDVDPSEWSEQYCVYGSDAQTPYPAAELPLARALRGESVDTAELCIRRHPEQPPRWLSVTARPVFDGSRPLGAVAVFQDITDRVRTTHELRDAKRDAEAASRAKSDFLAVMSHELRTPLNGVIGMMDLLLGTTLDAQQRRYAWLAKSSGDALLSLINDILDFSKVEAGKLELETADFDLRYAVESVAASLASRAQIKGLELIAGVHPSVPALVRGDPGRFQQILMNLLSNAIKFTERGEVSVRAALEREEDSHAVIRFSVNDSGIGIPHDRIDRLFELFSQADASTTRKFGGTGLGLAICKRLVQSMGGQIGVVSEPGFGSTFWFTVRFEKQSANPPTGRTIPPDIRALRVLVVDDNATNREILQEQLAAWGMTHELASNGREALSRARDAAAAGTPFGLMLLDLQMPEMDGRALARSMKSDGATRDAVLILLSSISDAAEASAAAERDFACALVKPVRQSQLLDAIVGAVVAARAHVPPDSARLSEAASVIPQTSIGGGANILLAEDHEIGQEVACAVLRRAGYRCEAVSTGRAAVDKALTGAFDLVLMDCQMPEMDGFTAATTIRRAEAEGGKGAHLPIIALTANAVKGDREKCLAAGMDDYLSKPLDPIRLVQMLDAHLIRRRPSRPGAADAEAKKQPRPVQAGPGGADEPAFDLEMMIKQWGHDRQFAETLIARFRRQAGNDRVRLQEALAQGDAAELARLAHRLNGGAGFLAARPLQRAAARLEMTAGNGQSHQLAEHAEALCLELARCQAFTMPGAAAGGDCVSTT